MNIASKLKHHETVHNMEMATTVYKISYNDR